MLLGSHNDVLPDLKGGERLSGFGSMNVNVLIGKVHKTRVLGQWCLIQRTADKCHFIQHAAAETLHFSHFYKQAFHKCHS